MGQAGDGGGWAARARWLTMPRHAPVLAGGALGVLAVAEQLTWLALGTGPGRLAVHQQVTPGAVPGHGPGLVRAAIATAGSRLAQAASTGPGLQIIVLLLLLCVATTVPLAFPRPAPAAVTVCAAALVSLAAFHALTVAGLVAAMLAMYRLGRSRCAALAAGLAVPFLVLALAPPVTGEARVLAVLLASLGPAVALTGFTRRARREAAEQGAAQQAIAGTLLEHTARGERARIARELHDVVAHHISMIAVQAETARLATPGLPPAGGQRLLDIGDTARSALTEMRRLLGVLREDARAATPGPAAADRRPQPGLGELNDLLDAARDASGTAARLILRGSPAALGPGAELAAYRIVQEALTNARRHAPGAAVDVELHYTGDVLRLRIRDNGPGPPAVLTGGHGLTGMRERAAAVGGELRTAAAAGGGFLIEAVLPVKAEAAA